MNAKCALLLLGLVFSSAGGVFAQSPVSTNSAAKTTEGKNGEPGYKFDGVALSKMFEFYSSIIGRTVLVHPAVRTMAFQVSIQARDKSEVANAFKNILREKEVASISDGEGFELIIPVSLEKQFSTFVQLHSLPNPDNSPSGYSYNFENANLSQVLDVYANLTGRKLTQVSLPSGSYNIRTQTPLTKAEAVHAFDVLLAFHELKAINAGGDSFKIVSQSSGKE
jgi:type II secretory pathway component GspD/PulD (secretin)